MSREENVFSQADALMRRHRSFLARSNGGASADSPALADRTEETDIPLLTEVVELVETAIPAAMPAHMQQALTNEVEHWLAAALPQHLEPLLEKLHAQLLADLSEEIRTTLLPRLLASLAEKRETEPV